jgi:hypothetical protein
MSLIMFSMFPGKPKNNRALNFVFVHAPDKLLHPHKFCLGGGVERFECRLMRCELKPLVPKKGREYVGMEI